MSPRGGKRKGAGRKPLPDKLKRKRITIRLPISLIDWLNKNKNGSLGRMIEKAIELLKREGENAKDEN